MDECDCLEDFMGGCDCLQHIYGWVWLFRAFLWVGVGGCDWVWLGVGGYDWVWDGWVKWKSPIKPMFLATSFSKYLIWSFQDRFSSSKTPRNLTDFTPSTLYFLTSNLGNKRGRSSFLLGLWKREYFVFPTWRESVFASKYSLLIK